MFPDFGISTGKIIELFRVGPLEWETFKSAFLDSFFPRELREAKLGEFVNLKQGNLSAKLYARKFAQ